MAPETVEFHGVDPVETGDYMCYQVPSSKPGKSYRVDLIGPESHPGYGQCQCTDWATRRWENIKSGHAMGTRSTMCKHVLFARRYFLNRLLVRMAKEHTQPDETR